MKKTTKKNDLKGKNNFNHEELLFIDKYESVLFVPDFPSPADITRCSQQQYLTSPKIKPRTLISEYWFG